MRSGRTQPVIEYGAERLDNPEAPLSQAKAKIVIDIVHEQRLIESIVRAENGCFSRSCRRSSRS